MSLPKQKFREIIFQVLYCQFFSENVQDDLLQFIMRENKVSKKNVYPCFAFVKQIQEKFGEIDPLITDFCLDYSFDRISSVEKNILRLSLYEMLYTKEAPPKVCISEGIRIARKYGSPESAKFVNAILDKILKQKDLLGLQLCEK